MLSPEKSYDLIYVIVNKGAGSQVLRETRKLGVSGATIVHGMGSFHRRWLGLLNLNDVEREIVWMVTEAQTSEAVIASLYQTFHLEEPNRGIVFSVALTSSLSERKGAEMFELITVIVDKGMAESAVDAARVAGASGATIINARGAGIHESHKFFNMGLEPEKDLVLILIPKETSEKVTQSIRQQIKIDEPGRGLLFVQQIKEAHGLYRE